MRLTYVTTRVSILLCKVFSIWRAVRVAFTVVYSLLHYKHGITSSYYFLTFKSSFSDNERVPATSDGPLRIDLPAPSAQ